MLRQTQQELASSCVVRTVHGSTGFLDPEASNATAALKTEPFSLHHALERIGLQGCSLMVCLMQPDLLGVVAGDVLSEDSVPWQW